MIEEALFKKATVLIPQGHMKKNTEFPPPFPIFNAYKNNVK